MALRRPATSGGVGMIEILILVVVVCMRIVLRLAQLRSAERVERLRAATILWLAAAAAPGTTARDRRADGSELEVTVPAKADGLRSAATDRKKKRPQAVEGRSG